MRGDSGFIHPAPRSAKQFSVGNLPTEAQRDKAMSDVDRATDEYPQVKLLGFADWCGLHVCCIGGHWQVWLNTEDATFTGLCVSSAATRQAAVAEAVAILKAAVEELQKPPAPEGRS